MPIKCTIKKEYDYSYVGMALWALETITFFIKKKKVFPFCLEMSSFYLCYAAFSKTYFTCLNFKSKIFYDLEFWPK